MSDRGSHLLGPQRGPSASLRPARRPRRCARPGRRLGADRLGLQHGGDPVSTEPLPSGATMRAAYEAESGKPWSDDPFCREYERIWREGWASAYANAPVHALTLALAVEERHAVR